MDVHMLSSTMLLSLLRRAARGEDPEKLLAEFLGKAGHVAQEPTDG